MSDDVYVNPICASGTLCRYSCLHCVGGKPCDACVVAWRSPKNAERRYRKASNLENWFMKKPVADKKAKGGAVAPCPDDNLAKSFPTMIEYLTTTRWEDGTPRERSTVNFFIEDGTLKACCNDRDLMRSLYVSAESWDALWEALEAAMADDAADWRAWKGKKK